MGGRGQPTCLRGRGWAQPADLWGSRPTRCVSARGMSSQRQCPQKNMGGAPTQTRAAHPQTNGGAPTQTCAAQRTHTPGAHLQRLVVLPGGHAAQLVAARQLPINYLHQAHYAAVLIVHRIEQQQPQRRVWAAPGGRDVPAWQGWAGVVSAAARQLPSGCALAQRPDVPPPLPETADRKDQSAAGQRWRTSVDRGSSCHPAAQQLPT